MRPSPFSLLMIFSIVLGACATGSAPQQESIITPGASASPELPIVQLPETDQIVFTIPNPEPFSGREGEPRPNWLAWGAEIFAVAPDGSFWIADTAVHPNRLLHYNPKGGLLLEISLENIVVYVYDLLVTRDNLWVLDISAQQPRIVQLNMDGGIQSSINIPEEVVTYDGQPIGNAVSSLLLGEEGELLIDSINGYYEMVDASGKITARPLDALAYYGHTYKTGIYDQVTGQLPVYVDGTLLETSQDLFIEVPFLGFNPDGSFAIAGIFRDAKFHTNHQVKYYNASGELLGTARQQPQTFYKDWNHHLALGPDGSVYQLLSNPDHSVQILRLGFSEEPPPITEMPVLTPTPLTILQPFKSAATDEEQARNALLAFFDNLSTGNYAEAVPRFGGDVNEYARAQMPGETIDEYWEYMCEFLWCLPVADITDTEQVSEDEFIFYTVFIQPDGTRFAIGACCGGDPAATPPVWQFAYPVKKIDGAWKVMRAPLFTP